MTAFDQNSRLNRVTAKGEHYMQVFSVLRQQLGKDEYFLP